MECAYEELPKALMLVSSAVVKKPIIDLLFVDSLIVFQENATSFHGLDIRRAQRLQC